MREHEQSVELIGGPIDRRIVTVHKQSRRYEHTLVGSGESHHYDRAGVNEFGLAEFHYAGKTVAPPVPGNTT